MRGDFTRSTYSPPKRYSGVRMQQGRVQLDADWNEQLDIQAHRDRVEARDVIGPSGVPKTGGGFQIGVTPDATELTISPGRLYVNGILCELFATSVAVTGAAGATLTLEALVADGVAFESHQWVELVSAGATSLHRITNVDGPGSAIDVAPAPAAAGAGATVRRIATLHHQPDLPPPSGAAPAAGTYLVYADVWERMISGVEDPGILEPALGGPDTAVRTRTLAQVKLVDASAAAAAMHGGGGGGKIDCSTFGPDWAPADALSTGRLRARAEPDPTSDDPCVVPPRAGYRGLENQLYRVEVHDGSEAAEGPTFKWSRDNASTHALVIDSIVGDVVTVADAGRDAETGFATARWIELSDESNALEGRPGVMVEVAKVEEREITVAAWPGGAAPALGAGAIARRWDAGPAPTGHGFQKLEQGVEVEFDGGELRAGDWWIIPARTRVGDVLWAADSLTLSPLWEGRHGTTHSYCALALATLNGDGKWEPGSVTDCRKPFPPLTDLPGGGGCCVSVRPDEDVQAAIDTVIGAGGGCVSLCAGRYLLHGPLYIRRAAGFRLHGTTPATQVRFAGTDDAGYGGIVVVDSVDVEVEDMLLVGMEDVPALVTLTSERGEAGATAAARLAGLTLLQASAGTDEQEAIDAHQLKNRDDRTCAIALEAARDVTIERCRMIAPVGVLAAPGFNAQRLEKDTGFGELPVAGPVRVDGSTIRFGNVGLLALRAHDWDVAQCRIEPLASESLLKRVNRSFQLQEEPAVALLRVLEPLFERSPEALRGSAVRAITWIRSSLRECRLSGARAVEVAGWVEGGAFDNLVRADGHGLHAMGIATATWRGNTIVCRGGAACSFGAAWRLRVEDNRVEAGLGIANLRNETLGREVVRELAAGHFQRYAILAFVLDLPEALDIEDAFAQFAGAVDARALTELLTRVVEENLPRVLRSRSALPLVSVRVEGNDIDASEGAVFLHRHTALGGMTVSGNRVVCEHGGAIRIEAEPASDLVELTAARLGAIGEAGIWRRMRRAADAFVKRVADRLGIDPGAVRPLADRVVRILAGAVIAALDIDYRVEGNAVLSLLTGIETNITGILIAGNEVEMIAAPAVREDAKQAGKALHGSPFLVSIGRALTSGARAEGAAAAADVARAAAREGGGDVRSDLAAVAARISTGALTRRFGRMGGRLVDAVKAGGGPGVRATLAEFGAEITAASASHAIVASGSGAWVLDNRITAQGDAELGGRAQGGIVVGSDFVPLALGVASGPAGADAAAAPKGYDAAYDKVAVAEAPTKITAPSFLWGDLGLVRGDALVARNRVSGGEGNGIELRGSPGSGIAAIRENTISSNGGAAIMVGRQAPISRLEIVGNTVSGCAGGNVDLGAVVAAVAVLAGLTCAVTDNRIEVGTCAAILVDGLAESTISRNRIVAGGTEQLGAAGILVLRAGGVVTIEDNEVEVDRGTALAWTTTFPTPSEFAQQATSSRFLLIDPDLVWFIPATTVSGNRLEVNEGWTVFGLSLPRVVFNGNSVTCHSVRQFGGMHAPGSLVCTSNTFNGPREFTLAAPYRAAVTGNIGDRPLGLAPPPLADERVAALNVPRIPGTWP